MLAVASMANAEDVSVSTRATQAGPEVTVTVGDYTRSRVLPDGDGDGWCDIWCDIFKEDIAHRNRNIDTDGDGLTDFAEMALWRNPSVSSALPHSPTNADIALRQAEVQARERRMAVVQAEARAVLAPLMHADVESEERGQVFSIEAKAAERRQQLAQ
jgi:hypothetical protein